VQGEARKLNPGVGAWASVFRITENRKSLALEMNPDLVPASGGDAHTGEESGGRPFISETFEDLDLGQGGLPFDRLVHPKRGQPWSTLRQREVFFFNEVLLKPPIRRAVSVSVPRDEKDSTRLAVDSVNREMGLTRIEARKQLQNGGLTRIRARNRKKPSGLIDGNKVSIFPKDREFGVHALTISG